MIPLSAPHLAGNEWKYVKECLDTGWVSSAGDFVNRFESELARFVGRQHAVATVNGTAALHVALLAAGVRPDNEVLVSTFTFIAPVNAVRYCGAYPVLVDAEPRHWQMDAQRVEDFLRSQCQRKNGCWRNKTTGRIVTALLPVDLYGHPVDLDPLRQLAGEYDLVIIEDVSEALGSTYKGHPTGTDSDLACYSFNGNKIITAGGGGMIVTNDKKLADRARYLCTQAKRDDEDYVHDDVGYNYRLTNLQAAMGVAQLEQLDSFLKKKRWIMSAYETSLRGIAEITFFQEAPWAGCTHWLVNALTPNAGAARGLSRHLAARGIQSRPLWRPAHLQKPYFGAQRLGGEVAESLYQRGVSLPSSVGITREEVAEVGAAIRDYFGAVEPHTKSDK